jgi:hypothetical protein
MQKVTSIYYSRTSYFDNQNKQIGVDVKLTIDYLSNEYSITPQHGKEFFLFNKANSDNWKMWKAVVQAIDNAIDFANKELKITGEDEEKVWQHDASPFCNVVTLESNSTTNTTPTTSNGSFVTTNVITDFID